MLLYSLKQFRRLAITEEMVLGISVALGVLIASSIWNNDFNQFLKSVPFSEFPLSYKGWLNEGLLSLFFAILGVELRADFEVGHLQDWRKAIFPLSAAIGALVIPALLTVFAVLISPYHEAGFRGWGIPLASAPVLTLPLLAFTSYLPTSIKSFVRAVLVFDDIGAILVLICFYGQRPHFIWLGIALFLSFLLILTGKKIRKEYKKYIFPLTAPLAVLLWISLCKAGVPASMAGLMLGLALPHRPGHEMRRFLGNPVSWLVLPLFAICNTSIDLRAFNPLFFENSAFLGPFLAFLIGKPVGIFSAIFLCEKFGLSAPWKKKYRHWLPGVIAACSLGFTVSLLLTQLAYKSELWQMEAETGLGFASIIATFLAVFLLKRSDQKVVREKASSNKSDAKHEGR